MTDAQFSHDLGLVTVDSPDFITLNEAHRRTDAQITPPGYASWRGQGDMWVRETPVLWRTDRWALVDHGTRLMHNHPAIMGPKVTYGVRYANWVTLTDIEGSTVSVVSAHTSPLIPGTVALLGEYVNALDDLVEELADNGPVLVGGDFNVHYFSTRYPRAALAAAGLVSTYDVLGQPTGGWATGTHHGATIDYILAAGATPTSHTTSDLSYSDHRALTAQLALGPGATDTCPPTIDDNGGPGGQVGYPVPAQLASTNQDNWGGHGSHWNSWHTGTDFSVPCGTPVLAAHAGTAVILPGPAWYGTQLVQVTTGPTALTTWYAHMASTTVTSGQSVTVGQILGTAGDLGNAIGCHLHFEVHLHNGSIYGPDNIDPTPWLTDHVRAGATLASPASSAARKKVTQGRATTGH